MNSASRFSLYTAVRNGALWDAVRNEVFPASMEAAGAPHLTIVGGEGGVRIRVPTRYRDFTALRQNDEARRYRKARISQVSAAGAGPKISAALAKAAASLCSRKYVWAGIALAPMYGASIAGYVRKKKTNEYDPD